MLIIFIIINQHTKRLHFLFPKIQFKKIGVKVLLKLTKGLEVSTMIMVKKYLACKNGATKNIPDLILFGVTL